MCTMPSNKTTTSSSQTKQPKPQPPQLISLDFEPGDLPTEDDFFDDTQCLLQRHPDLFQTLSQSCPDLETCVEIRIARPPQHQHAASNNRHHQKNNNNNNSCFSTWKPLLQLVTSSFPHLISLSIHNTVFDCLGHHALHLSDLAQLLQDAPALQHLSLQTTGLWVDAAAGSNGGAATTDGFAQLAQAVVNHGHLQHFSARDIYFCQTRRTDAWLFYSRLVQTLCTTGSDSSGSWQSSDDLTVTEARHSPNRRSQLHHHHHHHRRPNTTTSTAAVAATATTTTNNSLTHLTITTATKYYSRPILTLSALHAALQYTGLRELHLEHFNVWGGGGGDGDGSVVWQCSNSLRTPDCQLQTLRLRDCVFAGMTTNEVGHGSSNTDNNNNNDNSSILAGLQDNTSIQVLDLSNSLLHLEAAGLTTAVASNTTLQVLCLNGAKLGFELATHGEHLVRLLTAAAAGGGGGGTDNRNDNTNTKKHASALKELHLQDLWSDNYWDQQEQNEIVPLILQTLLRTVQKNRNLTKVQLLNSNHNDNNPLYRDVLVAEITLVVGLNRAKYWDFLQTSSTCLESWTTALSRMAHKVEEHNDEEDDDGETSIPVLFHMLREHPLMMVCQWRRQQQQQQQ